MSDSRPLGRLRCFPPPIPMQRWVPRYWSCRPCALSDDYITISRSSLSSLFRASQSLVLLFLLFFNSLSWHGCGRVESSRGGCARACRRLWLPRSGVLHETRFTTNNKKKTSIHQRLHARRVTVRCNKTWTQCFLLSPKPAVMGASPRRAVVTAPLIFSYVKNWNAAVSTVCHSFAPMPLKSP